MIRRMTLEDLQAVMTLENQLFSSPWTLDSYRFELTENPFAYYAVIDDDGIKAYLGLWVHEDALQITTLGVNPSWQGRGYGKQLVQYSVDVAQESKAKAITLEVRVSNEKAIGLYTSFGFKKVAMRKQYYSHPDEDAILMLKQIEQM